MRGNYEWLTTAAHSFDTLPLYHSRRPWKSPRTRSHVQCPHLNIIILVTRSNLTCFPSMISTSVLHLTDHLQWWSTDAEPTAVIGYVTLALTVSYSTPAPVIERLLAPVIEYIAPPPIVFHPSFSQQSHPVYTDEAVTGLVIPQCSTTAVEAHRCKISFRKFLRFWSWRGFKNKLWTPSKWIQRSVRHSAPPKLRTRQSTRSRSRVPSPVR